jgi:hypothetical protein
MAGNIATVSAVVADTTTPRERAKGMGVLGAAIGLGFVCGPAIGGLASLVDLREFWPQASDPTAALPTTRRGRPGRTRGARSAPVRPGPPRPRRSPPRARRRSGHRSTPPARRRQ